MPRPEQKTVTFSIDGREVQAPENVMLVDGAQSVGAMPVDVQRLGIDLLAFPGHKSLLGPPGTGALYVGPRVDLERMRPIRMGGTGLRSEDDTQPLTLPSRYESGTGNTVGIAALGRGVELVLRRTPGEVERHHRELRGRLVEGLAGIEGVRLYEPQQDEAAAVVSCTLDRWSPAEVGAILDQSFDIACRTGLHCAPGACATIGAGAEGTVRFSPGWSTTPVEVDAAVAAVREIAASALD
jgi:selenocysteine lyase/cysteine desulfurase